MTEMSGGSSTKKLDETLREIWVVKLGHSDSQEAFLSVYILSESAVVLNKSLKLGSLYRGFVCFRRIILGFLRPFKLLCMLRPPHSSRLEWGIEHLLGVDSMVTHTVKYLVNCQKNWQLIKFFKRSYIVVIAW